jgi:hypothetical protein
MLLVSENPPQLAEGFASISAIEGDWWVAHTKARAEKAFAWDLLEQSIPYYLPMTAGTPEDRYRVLRTNRVCQVIPVRHREPFVDEIQSIHRALSSNIPLDLYPFAAIGNRCRVAAGPLEGIEGIVIRKDAATRLVLQVNILGQGASLEISPDLLEPA